MRTSVAVWIISENKKQKVMCEISVVIPAYNEVNRIVPTLTTIYNYLSTRGGLFEVIVVNDGSNDHTVNVVSGFAKTHKGVRLIDSRINKGKGYALRKGMLDAKGEYCMFTDADGSTPIEELEKLLAPLRENKADVSIGSRYLPGASIVKRQPYYRRVWSRVSNKLVQKILLPGIIDAHCGFKAFTHSAAQSLFSTAVVNGWSFDLEILALARKYNLRIQEVPVKWMNDEQSKGRLRHLPKEIASVRLIRKRMKMIRDI